MFEGERKFEVFYVVLFPLCNYLSYYSKCMSLFLYIYIYILSIKFNFVLYEFVEWIHNE